MAVEALALIYGPFALTTAISRKWRLAHGVDPRPAYPGDEPLLSTTSIAAGSLAGFVLLAAFSGQVSAFNEWLLAL